MCYGLHLSSTFFVHYKYANTPVYLRSSPAYDCHWSLVSQIALCIGTRVLPFILYNAVEARVETFPKLRPVAHRGS
jgi:hypothetical protein